MSMCGSPSLTQGVMAAIGVGFAVSLLSAQQPRDGTRPAGASAAAALAGTVVTTDVPARPVGSAIVTISGDGLPIGVSAYTDERGAFLIPNLPAGTFTVTATKPGFVAGMHGARRPGEPGIPLTLTSGGSASTTIALSKGSVLTGTVRDARGAPVPDITVLVIDVRRPLRTQADAFYEVRTGRGVPTTDDRGIYRIYGLVAGEYLGGRGASIACDDGHASAQNGYRSRRDLRATAASIDRRGCVRSANCPVGPPNRARAGVLPERSHTRRCWPGASWGWGGARWLGHHVTALADPFHSRRRRLRCRPASGSRASAAH